MTDDESNQVREFLESRGKSAKEKTSDAVDSLRSRLSILEDKKRCDECSGVCEATYGYDPQTAAFYGGERPVWECQKCGQLYRREESKVTVDPYS